MRVVFAWFPLRSRMASAYHTGFMYFPSLYAGSITTSTRPERTAFLRIAWSRSL